MLTDLTDRCNAIEECYEFMLAYAAQGLGRDEGSQSGGQLRRFLEKAVDALSGLARGRLRPAAVVSVGSDLMPA